MMENQAQLSEKELARLKKKARPFWKKKRFILPAGFIALCIIIGVASSPTSSTAPATASASKPSTSTTSSKSASANYKVGQTFKDGEYQITINKVKTSKTISVMDGASTDKANGQYYIVNLTIKNLSKTASTVDSTLFTLEANGNKYSADPNASMDANISSDGNTNNDMFLSQLNPGVTMTSNLVFDVPTDLTRGVVLNISGGFTSLDSANVQLN